MSDLPQFGGFGSLSGVRIIENKMLTIGPFEDWSGVRSRSRAIRRRKRGYRQNIRFYYKPDPNILRLPDGALVAHPVTARKIREALK